MLASATRQPYSIQPGGVMSLDFHPGQWRAWDSEKRFVIVLAGTQGGKTSFGPIWLWREIQRCGPGDHLVVTPTYPLLNLKCLPELTRFFQTVMRLGEYRKADRVFQFDAMGERRMWGAEQNEPTRILFGHAQDPESLESATAKSAWLDEAGQNKFKLTSFEAIQRRLSLAQGRMLLTTTPYNLGWLKQQFWDRRNEREDTEVIRFDSTENPSFPPEEMERARAELPRWKFDMFYRAMFSRPAGMIYDCFDDAVHKIKAFPIPAHWPRYMGQDYGGVNTAAVYIAQEPGDGRYFLYREYWQGGKTAKQHTAAMLFGEETRPSEVFGGAASEGQWRSEFTQAGLFVARPPVSEVEVGINRVYGAFQKRQLYIFDTCPMTLDQVASYSRVLDDSGQPTEAIADKETFHLLDALRYIGSAIFGGDMSAGQVNYA
jgi:hypothetical protein